MLFCFEYSLSYLTSVLPDIPKALPECSHKARSVVRCSSYIAVLSEQGLVSLLHRCKAVKEKTHINIGKDMFLSYVSLDGPFKREWSNMKI